MEQFTEENTQTTNSLPQMPQQTPQSAPAFNFRLSDETLVVFKKATAEHIFRARKISGNDLMNVPYLVMTMISTFNGQKITLEDIKNLELSDFLLLEEKWNEFCSPKKPLSQPPVQ